MKNYHFKTISKQVLGDLHTPVSIYLKVRDIYPESALLESSDFHGNENSLSFIALCPLASIGINNGECTATFPDGNREVTPLSESYNVADAMNAFLGRYSIEGADKKVCGLFGYTGGMYVVISAPDGETLAKKTFNPRLGIEGGISILGTTGIVEPMSEQALVDTIHVELRQRRAGGADYVLLAPGNYGVDYIKGAMGIDPATAVMTSNFIGDALEICRELGFRGALLIGHIGKLVKLAGGMWNTHSRYGDCRMDILTACAAAEGLHGGAAAEMLCCATCDDALRLLKEQGLYDAVLHRLAGRIDDMMHYKCSDIETGAILFSKEYGYLCETKGASKLLRRIKED